MLKGLGGLPLVGGDQELQFVTAGGGQRHPLDLHLELHARHIEEGELLLHPLGEGQGGLFPQLRQLLGQGDGLALLLLVQALQPLPLLVGELDGVELLPALLQVGEDLFLGLPVLQPQLIKQVQPLLNLVQGRRVELHRQTVQQAVGVL